METQNVEMTSSNYLIVGPNLPTEEKAQYHYARTARVYDRLTGYESEHHRQAIDLANIQDGERVMEVACGTGRATVELAKTVGQNGKLDALDMSLAMMEQAQRKVREIGLIDRVEFRKGNAKQLPYPDHTFEVLYNSYMFDLLPVDQFEPILLEFKRVLKPGGRLVLANMSKDEPGKTIYESIYEKGWAGACRPVVLSSFVHRVGFENVTRIYRKNTALFIPLPFGTEIVTGHKPSGVTRK